VNAKNSKLLEAVQGQLAAALANLSSMGASRAFVEGLLKDKSRETDDSLIRGTRSAESSRDE